MFKLRFEKWKLTRREEGGVTGSIFWINEVVSFMVPR